MICASITEPALKNMIDAANFSSADMVEIRLDCLEKYAGPEKLREIVKPLIVTCMPASEGGKFSGTEEERMKILFEAVQYADYVSLELSIKKDQRERILYEARTRDTKVIATYHDYKKTPSTKEIKEILKKEKKTGADIAKVAFMANDYGDVMNLMSVLLENDIGIPIIAVSLGEYGKISRILGPLLGSYLTFASPAKGQEAAPGQLTVEELHTVFDILSKK
jgi:3-dehydroquinate dehydratase type I